MINSITKEKGMPMKRFLACCLALLFLLPLAACGADPADSSTAPPTETEYDYDANNTDPAESTDSAVVTELPSGSETGTETGTATGTETSALSGVTGTAAASGATAAPTTTAAAQGPKVPVGGTKQEIVKFYNTVANNTKAQKDFSVRKDEKLDCAVTEGALQVIDSLLDDLLRKDEKNITETFRNGKGTKDTNRTPAKFLPVGDKSYMSKLDPAWVKSASCVKKGSGWEIKITMVDETVLAKGGVPYKHDSCMDTLDIDWKNDVPFEVEDSSTSTISKATISAIVNPGGALLDELHIYEPVEVRGRIKVGLWAKLVVAGYWKQDIWFSK